MMRAPTLDSQRASLARPSSGQSNSGTQAVSVVNGQSPRDPIKVDAEGGSNGFVFRGLRSALAILVVASIAAVGLPSAKAQETGTTAIAVGTITGRVVLDDGRPPEGVTVSVRAQSGSDVSVSVDADGSFRATAESGKFYVVYAEFPGYLRVQSRGPIGPGYRIGDRVFVTLPRGSVITGRVTAEDGEPVVGLPVSVIMTHRDEQQAFMSGNSGFNVATDDRGIYRIFGLVPGRYLVVANPPDRKERSTITGFERNLATYYPSSSRADAEEVKVEVGREVTGIDIRFRKERGHSILGSIDRKPETSCAANVELREKSSERAFSNTAARDGADGCSFVFDGVPEGEYELIATQNVSRDQMNASEQKQIIIKNTDVSGIRLVLNPLGSIHGKVHFETLAEASRPPECKVGPILPERIRIAANSSRKRGGPGPENLRFQSASNSPTSTGEFVLHHLVSGTFTFAFRSAEGRWYVKSMTMPASPRGMINVGRSGIALRAGQSVTDLAITLTEGAGTVIGNTTNYAGSAGDKWRLFLVPKEPAFADEVFRYGIARIDDNSRFFFEGMPPGQYWLVARPIEEDRLPRIGVSPSMLDSSDRAKLRKGAEAAANLIEVKACQTSQGHKLLLPSLNQ